MPFRINHRTISLFLVLTASLTLLSAAAFSQSTSRDFPTPVRSGEISGTIRARDLGDPRRTTYYFTFDGNQGDIFINVVTKNFDGDIDVFTADTLKPLTKIVVYSDSPDNETGRVIYLRQSEKLILRIEGRTATDEPATFKIKFAGSFAPSTAVAETEEPKLPTIKPDPDAEVKVNSVGTIVAVKPKPTPTPRVEPVPKTVPMKPLPEKTSRTEVEETPKRPTADEEAAEKNATNPERTKPEVVVTDVLPKPDAEKESKAVEPKPKTPAKKVPATTGKKTPANAKKNPPKAEETVPAPNPLANVKLIVLFKDGSKIERPMTEVLRISVDKAILTIIHKDGSIGRYPLIEVARFAIE